MKTIIVIINGINLPFHVIDYVIDKAKKESYEIHALFLRGTKEPSKGYLYPVTSEQLKRGLLMPTL